ncbi:MAG: NADH-quinone oxidoreductase subunit C, partial [Candidatus Bathyarchaeia archaeon]
NILESKFPQPRRIFVHIKPEILHQSVSYLVNELNFTHLTTITGLDLKNEFEVIYHINDGQNELSIKIRIPRDKPNVPTITDIIPGAALYERELHDLFGIVAEGHPELKRIILPDNWPEGVYPMRKEWTIEKLREKLDKL